MDGSQPLDPRKTIFVGGVPRPLRAGILDFRVISLFLIMFSFHIVCLCNSLLNSECSFSVDSSMILHSKDVFFFFLPLPILPIIVELAMIMDRLYGGVCYAGIDTDPELKYPKGAGRVAFSNQQSYIAAISARFVQLQHGEIDKRVSSGSHQNHTRILPPSSLH